MIKESKYFSYGGRKSTDFNIINVRVGSGLYLEPLTGGRNIEEVFIPGREDPYFIDTTEVPKSLSLQFGFPDGWNEELLEETVRWLNSKEYKPLYFEGNIDMVYYAMPVDSIEKIHNGLKQGYLELTMRCSSSRAMSHAINTHEFNTKDLAKLQGRKKPVIELYNKGQTEIFPEIWIEKIDSGVITINNLTNANERFELRNIDVGEKLFIDNANEIINTDKERTYRYDDFNDNYLKIVYGVNDLEVSPNMKIRFRYRFRHY